MANTCELLITVVRLHKPKVLRGLAQKGCGPVQRLVPSLTQTERPPADRQSLLHQGMCAERGKPNALPSGTALREERPWGGG